MSLRMEKLAPLALLLLAGCESPQEQKLADCTTNTLAFSMTVHYSPPYQFVLGVPLAQTGQVSFTGEIVVLHGADTVARVPFTSRDATPCNWLEHDSGLAGYILTWSRTNQGQRLAGLLARKQTYDVHVIFTEAPPPQSSLWLSSISKPGL